ncbi:MAG: class I SAM-dependent methyltransferase [Acetobacteraceae bacterium]|nr:class I SAM-dependent methyltransferase [Acetobacteraceae bacterium]
MLDLLAPRPGERILNLGCGGGALTERIAAAGAYVVGCDASPELLAATAARGLEVHHADGHALPFAAKFDAVFSNAALHWMSRDPAADAAADRDRPVARNLRSTDDAAPARGRARPGARGGRAPARALAARLDWRVDGGLGAPALRGEAGFRCGHGAD